jgi:hypothetical protein
MTGFIKMPRGWMDYPALTSDARFTPREVFAWLVEQAAWKDRRVNLRGRTVVLSRGSLTHSTRYMGKVWQWPEPTVRRFIRRLRTDGLIDMRTDAGQTIISICDYDRDQETEGATDAEVTQRRRSSDAKEKKGRTDKKAKNPQAAPARFRAPAPKGDDLVGDEHAPTARSRLWHDGPAVVAKLTGLATPKARSLLGKMLAEARDDCRRVMQVLAEAEARHPLMDPSAFLLARARREAGEGAG